MTGGVQIEAVKPSHRMSALEFLLGGSRRDALVASRTEALRRLLSRRSGRGAVLLWARRDGNCVAAATVVKSPGRVGMLLHSPPGAPGVEREGLAAVIRAVSRQALDEGLVLVQTLVEKDRSDTPAVLESAGFHLLAELVRMRLSPLEPQGNVFSGQKLRDRREYNRRQLARVIAETYKGSLDCPELSSVRSVSDVIDCHKASGIYRPQSWWIMYVDQTAAGCILMNDSCSANSAEIIYLGVVPSHRGRGLGRAMLRHAAADAHSRGLRAIELAVDDANIYAKRLYESEGYRLTGRQWAYVMFHPDRGDPDR